MTRPTRRFRRRPILGCGAALLLALTGVSLFDARALSVEFVVLMLAASAAYVAALFVVARGAGSRAMLGGCLLLSLVWRGALVMSAPVVSDDVYRYVWDGRAQRFGYNPYDTVPDDPALEHVHTEVTRRIPPVSAALPTIYPPAAQLFFRLVTTVRESIAAVVVAVVLCDLLAMYVVWRWLLAVGRDPWWVLAYAWHPLVALEGAGGGHIDVVGMASVVVAGYTLFKRRTMLASVTLALACAIKFLPVVLLPLLWRRVRIRDAVIASAVVGACYLPFLGGASPLPVGSLGAYVEGWRFNGPLFAFLEPWLGVFGGLVLAVGGGLAVAAWARHTLAVSDPRAWAWPLAVAVLFMPAVYPWYLVWLTPFLTVSGTWPLVAWTLASIATYTVWVNELAGVGWVIPAWVEPLEYGLVAVTTLLVARTAWAAPRIPTSRRREPESG